jgi:23S rRNA pseudouridine1911/1915/1917 synthase
MRTEGAGLRFVVQEAEGGERLDRILADRAPAVSRMRLRQALDEGQVRVNDVAQPAGFRVPAGAEISLELDLLGDTAMTPEAIPLTVYEEDDELLVVEKPAGMVVHPTGGHRSGTLVNALAYYLNVAGAADPPIRPGLAHRLDRATSGLMVVAKTQRALSRLTVQFQEKRVRKEYLALVHGCVTSDAGEWHAPIGADPLAWPRWGVREQGRPAESRFRVERRWPEHTLLSLVPVTGRTNQLRLHAAYFGHPIVGDDLFGRGVEPGLGRLFLHAHLLEFTHPATGTRLTYASPLPEELKGYLSGLAGD